MRESRRNFFFASLALLAVASLFASWVLWMMWGGSSSTVPVMFQFLRSFKEERAFHITIYVWAAIIALALAAYAVSFRTAEERRPLVGVYLIGLAAMAPGAAILIAVLARVDLFSVAPIVGLFLAIPLLLFAFEFVAGSLAHGLGALCDRLLFYSASRRLYRLARLLQPGNRAILRRQGFAEYQSGAFTSARPIFERLYEEGATNPRLLEILETCYHEEGAWEKDIECLERLLEARPKDEILLRRLAESCERLGRWDRAIQARETFLDPKNVRQMGEVARLAMQLREWDRAVALIRQARDVEGRPYAVTNELYQTLLRENPDCVDAMEDMADLFVRMEAEPRAAPIWELILERNPSRVAARRRLADYLRRAGEIEREATHLRVLASLPDTEAEIDLRLAENLTEQRRPEEAKAAYLAAMKRHPGDFRFPHALCQQALVEGDLRNASAYLTRAETIASDSEMPRVSALRRRINQEKTRIELEELRSQVKADPDNLEARIRLIDRLASVGDSAEARMQLDALLSTRPATRPQVLEHLDRLIESTQQNFLLLDYKADLLFQGRDYANVLATYEAMAAHSLHVAETLVAGCEKILRAKPDFEPALERLGALMVEAKNWPRVVEIYDRLALMRINGAVRLAKPLFEANAALGRLADAYKYGLFLLKDDPDNLDLRMRIADLCADMERYGEALDVLNEAVKRHPTHTPLLRLQDRLSEKRKHQRIGEIEQALVKSPQDANARLELGLLHYEFHELDAGIAQFQKAAQNEALHNLATAHLMHCLALRGMFDLAEETLNDLRLRTEAAEDQEQIKGLIYDTAQLFEDRDLARRALAFYKTIFRIDASFRDVVSRIGKIR
ncbi:MAG: tetratricopeptide repeat protein [Candidatus Sumerlaeota bacterium]|nr:tetratricopeptide repeat protein [Candidatus Sumerlaeota bacterium]